MIHLRYAALGLGGVWLAQRATRLKYLDEQREAYRAKQREAAIEVLRAGSEWVSSLSSLIMAVGTTEFDREAEHRVGIYAKDLPEVELRSRDFGRVLVTARLVSASELQPALSALTELNNEVLNGWKRMSFKGDDLKKAILTLARSIADDAIDTLDNLEEITRNAYPLAPDGRRRSKSPNWRTR